MMWDYKSREEEAEASEAWARLSNADRSAKLRDIPGETHLENRYFGGNSVVANTAVPDREIKRSVSDMYRAIQASYEALPSKRKYTYSPTIYRRWNGPIDCGRLLYMLRGY